MTVTASGSRPRVDLGACISTGIDTVKRNPGFHIVAFLLVHIVGACGLGLLWGPMMVGYYRTLQKEAAGGKPALGDLFRGFDDFVPALVAGLVAGLATLIGFVLCIIPGLLLLPLAPTAVYLVAIGEQDGINAVRRAYELLKPNLWMGMLTMLVLGLLGNLGVIALVIGLLVTLPVAAIGTFALARQLTAGT